MDFIWLSQHRVSCRKGCHILWIHRGYDSKSKEFLIGGFFDCCICSSHHNTFFHFGSLHTNLKYFFAAIQEKAEPVPAAAAVPGLVHVDNPNSDIFGFDHRSHLLLHQYLSLLDEELQF
jgi:hypothetical protein